MNSDFPRIITLQRKERKISQKQAAADLGISQALLSHYEKGIRECGLDFLVKAADYYNVSCDYLLGRTASPDKSYSHEDYSDDVSRDIDIVSGSAALLLSLCTKADDNELEKDALSYIMLNFYKLFRMIYHSGGDNNPLMFKVSEVTAENLTDSVIMSICASIKLRSHENQSMTITTNGLSKSFPCASDFLKLLKMSEDKITQFCK